MKASDILFDAKQRIERGWCQGEYAMTADGLPVWAENPTAVCWCLRGAMIAAGGNFGFPPRAAFQSGAWDFLMQALPEPNEMCWNDNPTTTKADVIAVLDEAYTKAIEDGK